MPKQELSELAMMLAKEVGEKLVRIPGIDAVCVTLVGKDKSAPLGLIICHPERINRDTAVRSIARLSDHIEVLTQAMLEPEGTNGRTGDGQDSAVLGAAEHPQPVADGSHEQTADETVSQIQEAAAREGEQDRHTDRRIGDREVDDPGAAG